MENDPYAEDGRSSRRGRLMGKLFGGKDRKGPETTTAASLDAFLHSSADSLDVAHPPPPPPPVSHVALPKLDTTISRYPQALAVNQQAQLNRPLVPQSGSASPPKRPRPNRKGLLVRFVDSYPEVMGEGGDECEQPVIEISRRKRMRPPPPPAPAASYTTPPGVPPPRRPVPPSAQTTANIRGNTPPDPNDDFQPKMLARSPTGFVPSVSLDEQLAQEQARSSSRQGNNERQESQDSTNTLLPGRASSAKFLETTGRHDENRRSFIEIHQAEMREAEGQAFARASRTPDTAVSHDWEDGKRPQFGALEDSPESVRARPVTPEAPIIAPPPEESPTMSVTSNASSTYPPSNQSYVVSPVASVSSQTELPPAAASRTTSVRAQDAAGPARDSALDAFVSRTKHLYELFRLHAEAVKPLSSCSLKQCARAGVWWFLRGRTSLEMAIRERPTSAQGMMQNELDRQQAYCNLSKGYWLCEEAVPEIALSQGFPPDGEVVEVSQAVVSALKKLAASMQKNGFLPPEEAFLPQTIDKSIWVEYPSMPQDMIALLSGNWASAMSASQQRLATLHLLDAFPITDTPENFSYGRVMADVFLVETSREGQRYYFPCILSMVRPQGQAGLVFVIASQDGVVQLAIQENKNAGATWDDVRWRNDACSIDIRLPRGFMLAIQLTQADYRMLWSMYEFGRKLKATMFPLSDEVVASRNTLRAFQYIDNDPQSRTFPKEAVAQCDVAVFARIHKESGPAGQRNWHSGFRIAVVTGPRSRTLSGVSHNFPPTLPIQFGFFRGEGNAPALSLRFEDGRQKGRMVFSFGEEKDRSRFHSLLTGTSLDHDEAVISDAPLKNFSIAQSLREPTGMAPFSRMPWTAVRVVNEEFGNMGEHPQTVLSDRLRIILEYQHGTITDRVNVAPGELRMRLDVSNAKVIRILRQPQADITMAALEAQVPKELPRNMADALQILHTSPSIRSIEFGNLRDLHKFQAALTGYEVIFDGIAATFAIARRRMVVPIHKKWEAGFTRVQIVRHSDKQVQLLAFFEEFHHGYCMNFALKGTDVYESFHRGGKSGIRFVDAKFPLPQVPMDKDGDYDDMAFVCLDLPDLPGEHDDISIMFETEEERDHLCQCLPAPVKGSSRLSTRMK